MKKLRWIIAGVIAVAGIVLIAYPFIENYYNDRQTADMLQAVADGESTFTVPVQPIDPNDTDAWMESDGVESAAGSYAYEDEADIVILGSGTSSGGAYDDDPLTALTEQASNVEQPDFGNANEAVQADEATLSTKQLTALGRIRIDKIESELPVVEGAGKTELHYAVGHARGTADFGQMGNCVLAGHRNYTYGSMYNRLDEVEVGDDIVITVRDGTEYTYTVYEILTLVPGDPEILKFHMGEYKLSIVTCTPVRVASHRLVVQAHLTGVEKPALTAFAQ